MVNLWNFNIAFNSSGDMGRQGVPGVQGPRGPEGPRGPKGEKGEVQFLQLFLCIQQFSIMQLIGRLDEQTGTMGGQSNVPCSKLCHLEKHL